MKAKRLISAILCFMMLVSLVPVAVFADEAEPGEEIVDVEIDSEQEKSEQTEQPFITIEDEEEIIKNIDSESEENEESEILDKPDILDISNEFSYIISAGENLTYSYSDNGNVLIISGDGPMNNFSGEYYTEDTAHLAPWYSRCDTVTTIIIESGVTSIGTYAFKGFKKLTNVVLPYSLSTIGSGAFYNCSSLKSITLPPNLVRINSEAFYGCDLSQGIKIPGKVTHIGSYAFYNCKISEIEIPSSVTVINKSTFNNCSSLQKVVLPESIQEISEFAFYYCYKLEDIYIPRHVVNIGRAAFYRNLKYIFFMGNEDEWANITIYSSLITDELKNTIIHFNSTDHTVITDEPIPATCTETGLTMGVHCVVCNKYLVWPEIVPATGHTKVIDSAVAPTCTEKGLTEGSHCSGCGEVYVTQTEIPATGHNIVEDVAVSAWCEETGLTAGSHCSNCSMVVIAQEIIPATGHSVVLDKPVAATCAAPGYTAGSHCSVCGDILKAQEIIPQKDHNLVTDAAVEPTCSSTGLSEGSHCSVCGTIIKAQTTVAAKGHTAVTDAAVAATCTENGKTDGSHCSVCGTIIKAQTTVAAKGHTVVTDAAVEATCTETGKTEGSHCSVCDVIIAAQEEIPAKGHEAILVDYLAPTTAAEGHIQHIYCGVCGKYFLDSECKEEVSADAVIIPRLKNASPVLSTPANHADYMILTWNKVEGATSYQLAYREGNGSWQSMDVTLLMVDSRGNPRVNIKNLKQGATYTFIAYALFADDTKTKSASVTQTRLLSPAVTAKAGNGYINLTWNPVEGGSQYKIYYREKGGSWQLYAWVKKDVTTINLKESVINANGWTPLTKGHTYEFAVILGTSVAGITSGFPTAPVSFIY